MPLGSEDLKVWWGKREARGKVPVAVFRYIAGGVGGELNQIRSKILSYRSVEENTTNRESKVGSSEATGP